MFSTGQDVQDNFVMKNEYLVCCAKIDPMAIRLNDQDFHTGELTAYHLTETCSHMLHRLFGATVVAERAEFGVAQQCCGFVEYTCYYRSDMHFRSKPGM